MHVDQTGKHKMAVAAELFVCAEWAIGAATDGHDATVGYGHVAIQVYLA
jgi:hypothetical protein